MDWMNDVWALGFYMHKILWWFAQLKSLQTTWPKSFWESVNEIAASDKLCEETNFDLKEMWVHLDILKFSCDDFDQVITALMSFWR